MKIALIPWTDEIKQDNIFIPRYNGHVDSHILYAQALRKVGHEIHTIDKYENIADIDCFLFNRMDYGWLYKVASKGLLDRTVYCSSEPPVVISWNCPDGFNKILEMFANIMTWNDDWVDNKRIFKRNIPYYFVKRFGNVPFEKKKLLVNISGNKTSSHPLELYSERLKVITWFEQNQPEAFDLYGVGWDKEKHPSYEGTVFDKTETYHNYRFALCLENMHEVKGYITEKICDCLTAGIVPVYWGASNITEYVPQGCFIDYTKFDNICELYEFLVGIHEEEYNRYLSSIDSFFIHHDNTPFSEEKLCEYVCQVVNNGYHNKMKLSVQNKKMVIVNAVKEKVFSIMLQIRIKLGQIKKLIKR